MKIIKEFDYSLLEKKDNYKIGIHGIFGSFSHEAAKKFFPSVFPNGNYDLLELVDSESVFDSVCNGDTDIGICAFANSGSGGYIETLESMSKRKFSFLSTIVMPLNMCLVTHKDINDKAEIKKFFGHPVAIRQCEENIEKMFPNVLVEKASDKMDTALSAKLLSEGKIDKYTGVFCSKEVINIFPNLKVFNGSMQHDPRNATFFIIFSK